MLTVEVAVESTGSVAIETRVDAGVVVEVHGVIEIYVAVISVFHHHGVREQLSAVESGVRSVYVPVFATAQHTNVVECTRLFLAAVDVMPGADPRATIGALEIKS